MQENNIDSVKHTIGALRKHGFFEKYTALSDEQLFDTLHQQRIADYSKMFAHYYDPGMDLDDHRILMLDRERTVYGDTEADVGKDNDRYVALLEAFSSASGGIFNPVNITEAWESDTGPVQVSFKDGNEEIAFQPAYHDDWLSEEVFKVINQQMTKKGKEKFYFFLGKDGWGFGQDFLYIRMDAAQKEAIKKEFGWQFSD